VTVFEKTPILEAFSNIGDQDQESEMHNQLNLFK